MATFLIAIFSVLLVLVCFFVTLLVLMQKPSANSGMGAALGGGAAEQAFGGEAGNVLTKGTIYAIIAFFVISFGLYLGQLATRSDQGSAVPERGATISELESSAPPSAEADAAPAGTDDPGQPAGADAEPAAPAEPPPGPAEVPAGAAGSAADDAKAEAEGEDPLLLESLDGSAGNGQDGS
jgi:preprotein translocase subunit SecG